MLLQDDVALADVVVVVVVVFVVHKVNEAHYEYGSDMFVSKAVFHFHYKGNSYRHACPKIKAAHSRHIPMVRHNVL